MKKLLTIIGVALLAATANAQTNILTDIENVLQDAGLSMNPTNYALALGAGRSVKGSQTSAWATLVENVNQNVGVIAGIDHRWGAGTIGSADILSGGITLKASLYPLSFLTSNTNSFLAKVKATPFAVAMVGTPIGGTGNANGGLASIERTGVNIDIVTVGKFTIGGLVDYGQSQGVGNYNGAWIDFGASARMGF